MKTPVTESKLTASGMVCSNNDRDGVRLHGYMVTTLNIQHTQELFRMGPTQNYLRQTVCQG